MPIDSSWLGVTIQSNHICERVFDFTRWENKYQLMESIVTTQTLVQKLLAVWLHSVTWLQPCYANQEKDLTQKTAFKTFCTNGPYHFCRWAAV